MTDARADLPYSGELYRKGLHMIALLLPAAVVVLGKPEVLYGLVPLALFALALDYWRSRNHWLNRFIDRTFGWMMRRRERPAVGDPPAFNGATWVVTSMAVLTILFPVDVAVVAFCIFMVGDAAAALVGRRFGRTEWGRKGCTVEGSAAFFAAGLLTAFLIAAPGIGIAPFSSTWAALILATTAAMILEATPLPLNDNIAAPLGTALVLLAAASLGI
ncbi:MAG: phosphatidate cytidylyltransferase [Rhodothermales bacterium]|nr:phosphatidate cytidylyltransferase [Rhodothermales bacterium]